MHFGFCHHRSRLGSIFSSLRTLVAVSVVSAARPVDRVDETSSRRTPSAGACSECVGVLHPKSRSALLLL